MDTFIANRYIAKLLMIFLGVLSLFVAAKFISELRDFNYASSKYPPHNTVTVSGHGETFAVPDVAEITFDISANKKTVPEAQKEVTEKMNAVIEAMKKAGIAEKDIKTVGYNIYPQYEYQTKAVVCPFGSYCPPSQGTQVLIGYEARHSILLKVRKTEEAGSTLATLGSMGVTNLSGINFTIDDEEKVKDDAREMAINDAKEKAEVLAKQLGVRLGRVVNFSESGDYPMYYSKVALQSNGERDSAQSAPVPNIPAGENQVNSDISITYELR